MRRLRPVAAVAAALAVVGCVSTGAGPRPSPAEASTPVPVLTGSASCAGTPGFSCSTLRVPLDHSRRVPGTLDLKVAVADNADAPRGILLVLAGGPGQPGVALVNRVKEYFDPEVLSQYRMVMFDQRGTGTTGINCAELQTAVGGSDFITPPAAATEACGAQLGRNRDFYGTPDTVADIDVLRQALRVPKLTLDGVSYGTFVGEHYALRYPSRVQSLVLDSVVPHQGFDPFITDELAAAKRVLTDTCRKDPSCTTNPVADLAWLVRHGTIDGQPINGTSFVEGLAVLSLSTVNPSLTGVPGMLDKARHGDTAQLKEFFESTAGPTPYEQLSAGLHMATLCKDLRFPWGTSAAPLAGRAAAVDRAARRINLAKIYPYDVATARNALAIQGCEHWQPTTPSTFARSNTITPRTLILHGQNDLFCPVDWAYREKRHTTNANKLVVIPDMGHGTQGSRTNPTARTAVRTFLLP